MKLFITGGAGFIGCNSADYFLKKGHDVVVFDNFSRKGTQSNLDWLHENHGDAHLTVVQGDIRDFDAVNGAIGGAEAVLHLAAQVAVTTSVKDPREDFEINALGTFNVLEATRLNCPAVPFITASTNKVYGGMETIEIAEAADTYMYADLPYGISEDEQLDFHSPYGCSKGAADQYTIDYARIYGLKSVALRQSCIYGLRQFGVEDQGWAAHFIIATVKGRPISIYGDGKQARDMLNVKDLIRAYEICIERADNIAGQAFNIGGGPNFTLSIWRQFGPLLEQFAGRDIPVTFGEWRPGDQKVFVADIRKAQRVLGWSPKISPEDGLAELYSWVASNPDLF